jgi:hypothetical protein
MTQEGLAAIFEIALLIGSTKGLKNPTGDLPLPPLRLPCPITTKYSLFGVQEYNKKVREEIFNRFYLKEQLSDIDIVLEYVEGGRKEGGGSWEEGGREKGGRKEGGGDPQGLFLRCRSTTKQSEKRYLTGFI